MALSSPKAPVSAAPRGIITSMEAIAADLVAAGVRATFDPRRVDPPCALVVPERANFESNCVGQGTTDWVIHVLGGQPGGLEAMRDLSAMTAKVLQEIHYIESVDLSSYATDSGDAWPSFDLRFRTVSSWT